MARFSRILILAVSLLALLVQYNGCGNTHTSKAVYENSYSPSAMTILGTQCTSCHTADSGPANVFDVTDTDHLVSTGLIVPGQPDSSPLITAVTNGSMPPGQGLSGTDRQTLKTWVASMTYSGPTPPKYLSATVPMPANIPSVTAGTVAVLRFDLSKLNPQVPALAGAILEVEILMSNPTEYQVQNPKIAGISSAVQISGIHVFVNTSDGVGIGFEDINQGLFWTTSSVTIPATALPNPLPAGPMSISSFENQPLEIQAQSTSDVMTIGFDTVQ
jgi:hypothetical protein